MIKQMSYTKANGDISDREVIVVSAPKVNYLVYDVSKLSATDREILVDMLAELDTYRDEAFAEFEKLTGIKQSSLWRSFKPEGIEWTDEI
jgi:hypothetical protein